MDNSKAVMGRNMNYGSSIFFLAAAIGLASSCVGPPESLSENSSDSMSLSPFSKSSASASPVRVGAIKWDYWHHTSPFNSDEIFHPDWYYRIPFHSAAGNVSAMASDRPEVVEQEILYAHKGGIDYWAYVFYNYGESSPPTRIRNYHRMSPNKHLVNYSLILTRPKHLFRETFDWNDPSAAVSGWEETIDQLIEHFSDSNYERVEGDRPLVYWFQYSDWVAFWDDPNNPDLPYEMMDLLKEKSIAAGQGEPYFAMMTWHSWSNSLPEYDHFDGLSAYASNADNDESEEETPYSTCMTNDEIFRTNFGEKHSIIPIVTTGWDDRPLRGNLSDGTSKDPYGERKEKPWCQHATPDEIVENLDSAVKWVNANPQNSVNTVLMYAWNEFGEGGFLAPVWSLGNGTWDTSGPNTARLDAIADYLGVEEGEIGTGEPEATIFVNYPAMYFQKVPAGESKTFDLWVINRGEEGSFLHIEDLIFRNNVAGSFHFEDTDPTIVTLGKDESKLYTVTYTANSIGRVIGEIIVNTEVESRFIDLSGIGLLPKPTLATNYTEVMHFQEVEDGQSKTLRLWITNEGDPRSTLVVGDVILNAGSEVFSLEDEHPDLSKLGENEAKSYLVTFEPDGQGYFTADIIIHTNAGMKIIVLLGNGV